VIATGRRNDVLAVLRTAAAPLSIAQIAEQLAVHPNTVRFHLDALVESGRVERVESDHTKPGRPPLMFRVVPGMDPAGPRRYRLIAEILARGMADETDSVKTATAAGRAWGIQLQAPPGGLDEEQAVDQLVDLLDDLGFAPQRRSDGDNLEIGLRNCPFLELAQSHAEVVCPIHLGLMQGAMTAWNAPITVVGLTPFIEPDLCVARLTPIERSP
jgi:predicted ArsR family transcriptional regulator